MKLRPLFFVAVAAIVSWIAFRATSTSSPVVAIPWPADRFLPEHREAVRARGQTGVVAARAIGENWIVAPGEFAAFRAWAEKFLRTPADERSGLIAEGRALAAVRRAALARLIRHDPRAALAAAVPMVVRQQLPAAVVESLETRVSGRGDLALNAVTPAPGVPVVESQFRSTVLAGREYRAFVYGRREAYATVRSTSIVGIAVDGDFAVSESPLRVLEAGEIAGDRPIDPVCPFSGQTTVADPATPLNTTGTLAVEYGGKVQILCSAADLDDLAADLIASEVSPRNAADDLPGTSGVANRPSQTWTHGAKKVLIIRVDFTDFPGTPIYPSGSTPITDDFVVNVFTATNGVNDFYAQGSFGKTALQIAPAIGGDSVDVTSVFRMPQTATAYATGGLNGTLHSDARAAATAAGVNVASYDRVGVVFRYLGASVVPGSQLTYAGLGNIEGPNFWINGYFDFRVVAHEIGHNYGLQHANLWQVGDGNPISPNGSSVEYGDAFDTMGNNGDITLHFSPWNKSILQWLPDAAITTIAAPGTYRVYRFDDAAANLANARALKIVRDATRDYWIGYRRATSNSSMDGGAYIIWGHNTNEHGDLLDMTTPGTNVNDAGLAVGATFNDSTRGITIKPVAQGGSGAEEYLDVQIDLTPLVQWAASSIVVDESAGSATLTVSRTRNSAGALTVDYATAAGTAVSGTDFTARNGTLTWADGDTSSRTITIPITPDAIVESSETFTVTLSNPVGGTLGDTTSATVTILDPGVRAPGFSSDFINSSIEKILPLPDGSIVVGGWFSSVQDSALDVFDRGGITKVDATGKLDTSFASGGGATGTPVFDLARQPDGKIIVVGAFTAMNGTARNRIARLNADGTLDPGFDPGSGADNRIYAVLLQPDGKIVIGGAFTNFNGTPREYLARLNADGSLDATFVGPDFGAASGWFVESLAMQPDGKLLVGGQFYFSGAATFKSGLCRIGSTGALDSAFNGVAEGAHAVSATGQLRTIKTIAVQPDGKILIGGAFTAFNNTPRGGVARLTGTGALDGTFAPTSDGDTNSVLLLPDGRVLLGGTFTMINGNAASRLTLLSAAGATDTAFAAAGGYSGAVRDLALLPGGRVLLGGDYASLQSASSSRPLWQLAGPLAGTPGVVQLAAVSASGTEGGTAQLTVTRGGTGIGALAVGYATIVGTAGANDFTATSGALTWADGDTAAKTITVSLTNDGVADAGENFFVQLGQPLVGGAILGGNQRATLTINELTGYAAFNAANFTPGELANASISGPSADPDGDGLANLVEYALGLNPRIASTSGVPVASATATDWVFTYTRPASATDVTYAVEFSATLASWSASGVTHQPASSVNGVETWRATVPLTVGSRAFFRLRIDR